jgi:hypothetical protein
MSQIVTIKTITEEYRETLKELCKKATQVVGWYPLNTRSMSEKLGTMPSSVPLQ